MRYRTLGRTGWQVSDIGAGMWGLAAWKGNDEDQVRPALQLAVDLGCNFFDTAWGYGSGASEKILGEKVGFLPQIDPRHKNQLHRKPNFMMRVMLP